MSFEETWPKATVDGSNSNPPQEGEYELLLKGASAFNSKAGKDIVTLDLEVVSAIETGYEWTELRSFASQGAANAAKATCHRLGVDVESVSSLEELDSALKAVVGGYFSATVKRNGEYLNTYINEATQAAQVPVPVDPEPVPSGVASADGDDIPF